MNNEQIKTKIIKINGDNDLIRNITFNLYFAFQVRVVSTFVFYLEKKYGNVFNENLL